LWIPWLASSSVLMLVGYALISDGSLPVASPQSKEGWRPLTKASLGPLPERDSRLSVFGGVVVWGAGGDALLEESGPSVRSAAEEDIFKVLRKVVVMKIERG